MLRGGWGATMIWRSALRVNLEMPPVFVIGSGRSGTTLLYNLLALHSQFTWISNLADRARLPELAILNPVYRRFPVVRGRVLPSEGYRLWNKAWPGHRHPASGVLTAENVSEEDARGAEMLLRRLGAGSKGPAFLNKNTRNTRRVLFLDELFPDARFVHVIRHPGDACSSVLEVAWWPHLKLWIRDGETPAALAESPADEARLAAELWVANVTAAHEALGQLSPNRVREVRYEELVAGPEKILSQLLDWLGMDFEPNVLRSCGRVSTSSVGAYAKRLGPEQVETVYRMTGDTASDLGYELTGR